MFESRVEKFKSYRENLSNEGNPNKDIAKVDNDDKTVSTDFSSTSTLPIDEVITYSGEDKKENYRRFFNSKYLKIIISCVVSFLIVVGIIIWAIFAFGGF